MKTQRIFAILLACFALTMMSVRPAMAQNDPRDRIIPRLEIADGEINDALKQIFRFAQANYVVSSDVQGTVTVDLTNVPFETALRAILNQVDSTWRLEGGIYNIIRKPVDAPIIDPGLGNQGGTNTTVENFPRRIRIRNADPYVVFLLIRESFNLDFSSIQPEMSTAFGIQSTGNNGGGQNGGGGGQSGAGGGNSGGGGLGGGSGGGGGRSGGGGRG